MAKLMLYVLVALLATSFIMAAPDKKLSTSSCGRHGDPVSICTFACFIFLINIFFLSLSFFKNAFSAATINKENGEKVLSTYLIILSFIFACYGILNNSYKYLDKKLRQRRV